MMAEAKYCERKAISSDVWRRNLVLYGGHIEIGTKCKHSFHLVGNVLSLNHTPWFLGKTI